MEAGDPALNVLLERTVFPHLHHARVAVPLDTIRLLATLRARPVLQAPTLLSLDQRPALHVPGDFQSQGRRRVRHRRAPPASTVL